MLHVTLSKAARCGLLLLFVVLPFTSYQHPQSINIFSDNSIAGAVPATENNAGLNTNAVKFVNNYIKINNEELVKIKERSNGPFKAMDKIFRKYHLPVQLKYLAVIESELKASAVSRVGAAGPWQLMPATAKLLGLKISDSTDERKQYNKSTKAAALYLRDLYREFGDWLLVMAAYNCGPAPVYKAIRKSGSHDFWNLQAYLPGESREHVKKFIATHYYFEGKGSITTFTKAENIQHSFRALAQSAKEFAAYKEQMARFQQSIAYGY